MKTLVVFYSRTRNAKRVAGLVSQSVLWWDGMRLEMEQIAKDHTRINLFPQGLR